MKMQKKEKVDLVVQMGNVEFVSNSSIYHIELNFSLDYTIEEITKLVNEYIYDKQYYYEMQTQIPKYYKKLRLAKCPSKLW